MRIENHIPLLAFSPKPNRLLAGYFLQFECSRLYRSLNRAYAFTNSASKTSRTFRERLNGVNGFWINSTFESNTP